MTLNFQTKGVSPNNKYSKSYIRCIKDDQAPTITLNGDKTIYIIKDGNYTNSGATAWDSLDGDLSSSIILHIENLNLSKVGDYNVTYSVVDSSGNKASIIQEIKVLNSNFVPHVITTSAKNIIGLEIVDINGDGNKDIVVGRTSDDKSTLWYSNLSNFRFITKQIDKDSDKVLSIATGDIDNDGFGDVIYLTKDNISTCIFDKDKNTFDCLNQTNSSLLKYLKLIDYDGDSDLDLVTSSERKIYFLKNSNGNFTEIRSKQDKNKPLNFGHFDSPTNSLDMGQLDKDTTVDLVYKTLGSQS